MAPEHTATYVIHRLTTSLGTPAQSDSIQVWLKLPERWCKYTVCLWQDLRGKTVQVYVKWPQWIKLDDPYVTVSTTVTTNTTTHSGLDELVKHLKQRWKINVAHDTIAHFVVTFPSMVYISTEPRYLLLHLRVRLLHHCGFMWAFFLASRLMGVMELGQALDWI